MQYKKVPQGFSGVQIVHFPIMQMSSLLAKDKYKVHAGGGEGGGRTI